MNLKLHNTYKKKNAKIDNIISNNFFFDEFEKNIFFTPLFKKDYFQKYSLQNLINKKNKVHVFGMGGSSLSSKLLIQFMEPKALDSKIFIYDNPYEEIILKKLTNHKISNYDKFIFISKSGKTAETKYFLSFLEGYLKKMKIKNFHKNFIFVTENTNNYLRNYGNKNNIVCLEHDPNIGGRFSIFSITGYLPMVLIGYSLSKLVNDAKNALNEVKKEKLKIGKHLLDFNLAQRHNKLNIFVGLTYNHKLTALNEWYRQIFAESLGKSNNSITYIASLGPIDQHSQFQLYIDGPKDKSYVFFNFISKNKNILNSLFNGAIKTLIDNGDLVNSISINNNFKSYNKLIILLIFDIFLRSKFENINFLDQPAVEILKKNTKV